ncbi:hypothetical protein SH528x_003881 [Novipirellula sp. SH528]|uniref:hypothetical protein n=1 Tax=Novipirellula sp. SH528 TaxID=3454466 RepID=UPI003F9EC136
MNKTRFIKTIYFLLLPVSATLVLLFSSLATFDVMSQISELMVPNSDPAVQLPIHSISGQIGLVLVALGMVMAMRSRIDGTLPRITIAFAAVVFCLAALGIGVGTLQLESAFRSLATAATIDPESFEQGVVSSKIPLLFGWSCLLVASTMVFVAVAISAKSDQLAGSSLWRRPSFLVATLSLVLILLVVAWNVSSLLGLRDSLSGTQIEPSAIARGVTGMTRSVFVSLVAVLGWAISCVLMAIREERVQDIQNREPATDIVASN